MVEGIQVSTEFVGVAIYLKAIESTSACASATIVLLENLQELEPTWMRKQCYCLTALFGWQLSEIYLRVIENTNEGRNEFRILPTKGGK